MTFQSSREQRPPAANLVVLENCRDGERAEIDPDKGFNCFRWAIQQGAVELLYADPQFLAGSSPTRTGIPILFPFPNRIRDGKFTWQGKEYQLPLNDPAKKNAIHGFACRRAWQVVDHGADDASAWATGEFLGSRDAADCKDLWPADYRLRITFRLLAGRLRIEARVENPDSVPLPFGLGFHHYLSVGNAATCQVQVPAKKFWELTECLPTGRRLPIDSVRDLNTGRPFTGLNVDDVLTELPDEPDMDGLCYRGSVRQEPGMEVRMFSSPSFRETVIFTPPHRQAFCIEPYTCVTDAINLSARIEQTGLSILPPGGTWTGVVEMRASELKEPRTK